MVHPAAILRGRFALEPHQVHYIARVRRGEPPEWDINKPAPGVRIFPSLKQIAETCEHARKLRAVTIDLETAGPHLICAGLEPFSLDDAVAGRVVVGPGAVVRFRRQGGGKWWTDWAEHLRATTLLAELLADPGVAKLFHNGITFDVPELEAWGFEVEGRLLDTLVMAHRCYPEMPRGLQWLATRFLWAPNWKTMTDDTDEPEGKA